MTDKVVIFKPRSMNVARFPISGPKEDPTAEDYELEARLLWMENKAHSLATLGRPFGHSSYAVAAHRFEKTARRKRWTEATGQVVQLRAREVPFSG